MSLIRPNFAETFFEAAKSLGSIFSSTMPFLGRIVRVGSHPSQERPASNAQDVVAGSSILQRVAVQGTALLTPVEVDKQIELARQDVNSSKAKQASRDAMARVMRNDLGKGYTLEQRIQAALVLAGAKDLNAGGQADVIAFL
ncbi:MAG TPA: hypothetical protein PLV25_06820, partial [Opitutales bacterium]|nr:hypothetical protein [Opitutales bacterium]